MVLFVPWLSRTVPGSVTFVVLVSRMLQNSHMLQTDCCQKQPLAGMERRAIAGASGGGVVFVLREFLDIHRIHVVFLQMDRECGEDLFRKGGMRVTCRYHGSGSGPCSVYTDRAGEPIPRQPIKPSRNRLLAAMFSSEPLHSIETTPSQAVALRKSMHRAMFSELTPPPSGTLLQASPRIRLERDGRVVAHGLDEVLPMYDGELKMLDPVSDG